MDAKEEHRYMLNYHFVCDKRCFGSGSVYYFHQETGSGSVKKITDPDPRGEGKKREKKLLFPFTPRIRIRFWFLGRIQIRIR